MTVSDHQLSNSIYLQQHCVLFSRSNDEQSYWSDLIHRLRFFHFTHSILCGVNQKTDSYPSSCLLFFLLLVRHVVVRIVVYSLFFILYSPFQFARSTRVHPIIQKISKEIWEIYFWSNLLLKPFTFRRAIFCSFINSTGELFTTINNNEKQQMTPIYEQYKVYYTNVDCLNTLKWTSLGWTHTGKVYNISFQLLDLIQNYSRGMDIDLQNNNKG